MSSNLRAVEAFIDGFGLHPQRLDRGLLEDVGRAFSRLPYENLTKLLQKHRYDEPSQRRRAPDDVMRDHLAYGAGGTCFALVELFRQVLGRLGFRCFPVLCDTRHRPGNHSALVAILSNEPHLIDPGYLLYEPLPLRQPEAHAGVATVKASGGQRFELFTYGCFRYRFSAAPPSEQRLIEAWDASFDGTMMNDVHICATRPQGGYAYLHGRKLRLRDKHDKQTESIRGREVEVIATRFGIGAELVRQVYDQLDGRLSMRPSRSRSSRSSPKSSRRAP